MNLQKQKLRGEIQMNGQGATICTTAPVSHAVGRRPPQRAPQGDSFKNSQKSELPFGYLALPEAGKYDGFHALPLLSSSTSPWRPSQPREWEVGARCKMRK